MIGTFKEFISNLVVEELHPELQDIVKSKGSTVSKKTRIANKIKEKEPDSEIVFFGTNRGLENDLVPRAGYELKTIEAYGIQPKPSINNIKQIIKTMKSTKVVKKFIDEFKRERR